MNEEYVEKETEFDVNEEDVEPQIRCGERGNLACVTTHCIRGGAQSVLLSHSRCMLTFASAKPSQSAAFKTPVRTTPSSQLPKQQWRHVGCIEHLRSPITLPSRSSDLNPDLQPS